MKVYGIIGWKDSGKTSLMERLVAAIVARGFTVSTVKHVHHDVDLDQPGKDTFRHRAAGASEVVLASAHRFALMHEHRGAEPDLTAILSRLAPVDLVLVEGYKRDSHRKIEVHRPATGHQMIQPSDPLIRAVASDAPGLGPLSVPLLDLNDSAAVADFVLSECGLTQRPLFDEVLVADWSAAAQPKTKPGPDSIWIGICNADGVQARHFATRALAEAFLHMRLTDNRAAGRRTLAGFDFAFGYPAGFAAGLTGQASARAVWAYLAAQVQDGADNANNRFAVAAAINTRFDATGPFWGGLRGQVVPGLTPTKTARYGAPFLAERRAVERAISGTSTVWQLTGAGAVGSQSLVGLPMVHRLVADHQAQVWPFDSTDGPIVLAEVYPSLLRPQVREMVAAGWVTDAAQVRLLAQALFRLAVSGDLQALLAPPADPAATEEGWILGADHAPLLRAALTWP